MKRILRTLCLGLVMLATMVPAFAGRQFQTVPNDPLDTKIYTLPNGLKIFMSVNKDAPRIQTYIAVRVGGKNDPAETTGLAHYFEHLMFKGTEKFGTQDYAAEKPLLDEIEQLFETYRQTKDSTERAAIYHAIDSISYQASLIAIPNEYDKLMAAIGADGTNAYTSYDVTCYVEDIPSNQIENWAKIQADRFENPVIRGFHTELETIYEEKNMSLTKDNRKMSEKMLSTLYPSHPYGAQTVLGTQEHLKNPSITNVKNYHKQWYVPNNMAICLSGDFDPDEMVDIIEKYFGHLQPNPNLPVLQFPAEVPFTQPVEATVLGKEAEYIYLAWRIPGVKDEDMPALEIAEMVLQNGNTGLLDVNIDLPQLMLGSGTGMYDLADQGAFLMVGHPKPGQTLDDVRALLLEQVALLREGKFSESMLPAIVNNERLNMQRRLESNDGRADMYVDAFVNGQDWSKAVERINNIDKITKEDVVRVANKYLGPDNYAAIYKRQGDDPNEQKISKPSLTPIAMNREATSQYLTDIRNSKVDPIEPVFVDFKKDLSKLTANNGVEVLYTPNTSNDLFQLTYVYDHGTNNNPLLSEASGYIEYLGTPTRTAQQIKDELYALACSFRVVDGARRSYIVLSGLSENMPQAMAIMEDLLANAQVDKEAYDALVDRIAQAEENAKTNQSQNFGHLTTYMMRGEHNGSTDAPHAAQLRETDPQLLIDAIKELSGLQHRVIYYGGMKPDDFLTTFNAVHNKDVKELKPAVAEEKYPLQVTDETIIYVAPYPAKQLYMRMYSNAGEKRGSVDEPLRQFYNEYFGGSMNAIVFQEMRESRSLAYSAGAGYSAPGYLDQPYYYNSMIATQNDKLADAIAAFTEIINDMPESQKAFELAKEGIDARLRTDRIIKDDIAWAYLNEANKGNDHDSRRDVFEALPSLTLDDIVKFQQKNVKGRTYRYCILGDTEDLDMDYLRTLGKVVVLTPEQIFGY
ncbi:MAG: insulinase family protein [Muribaculaceae bacterium]|nr:insulinase family protein [Muribaculaceae bacterium]